jgi:uncharacterized membrane protein
MENVVSIERLADDRFRWTVKAPMGREVSWESLITHEVPGEEISWQSADGAEIDNSGKISFLDAGERGTLVRVRIAYDAPGGAVGQLVAKLFQREPRILTRRDLHRFKQLLEAGEIPTAVTHRSDNEAHQGRAHEPVTAAGTQHHSIAGAHS